jgi:hypothetical protein
MKAICWLLVWEWINIALEYTATAWVRLPRWFLAVVAVNLVTHPAFTLALDAFDRSTPFVISCEIAIFLMEAFILMAAYGFRRWRLLLSAALLMNGASYITGLLMELAFG